MVFTFKKNLYPKIALLKSAYAFTDIAYLHLDENNDEYIVSIESKDDKQVELKDFENEMIFQTVRNEIYKRTSKIRNLTLSRAMASTIVASEDDFSELVSADDEACSEEILKDWFESDE